MTLSAKTIQTPRLTTRVLFSGDDNGVPVLFLHGNASSATFWEDVMLALPDGFRGIAPDQRGYGEADPDQKVHATRGVQDFVDDAFALLDTLGIEKAHVVGHSAGSAFIWQMLIDQPHRILSAVQVNPGSPYGFGGTKDIHGTPCFPDFAGSGGGIVNPNFPRAIAAGDRSENDPQASPRVVMNTFYWKPPFRPAREEDLLTSLLSQHIGVQDYPGDFVASENYPNVAPGEWGVINALSPKYVGDVSRLYQIDPKPKILWIRGSDDQIVSDNSMFDFGTLGMLGFIPNYPGVEIYPPQPMVSQTRAVLEKYGNYEEVVIEGTGHTPYIEKPDEFNRIFHAHLKG